MRYQVYQFLDKTDNFEFLSPNLPKSGFWVQNFKKSGFGISILEILRAPIFRQNEQLWIFGPKFAQKWILGSKFQQCKSGFGISILKILCAPIFRQNGQCWIFVPKFAQKWILRSEFQKSKSGFGISTSNISCVPIFSQNGQFLIFWPKFGEIAQLRAKFWFKYCWGCCRELGGGGWSWVEVEMSWVELSARFSNTRYLFDPL